LDFSLRVKAVITSPIEKIDVLLEHLESLEQLCELFFTRNAHTIYRSISGPLRFLLVGSTGDEGLVKDVLPAASFHRLKVLPQTETTSGHLTLPAWTDILRGRSSIRLAGGSKVHSLNVQGGAVGSMSMECMFDTEGSQLPILDWLAQPFLWQNRTLADFIRTVANKDGVAHLGSHNDLLAMKRWGHLHWHLVAHVGRYVLAPIREQLTTAYPAHKRAER